MENSAVRDDSESDEIADVKAEDTTPKKCRGWRSLSLRVLIAIILGVLCAIALILGLSIGLTRGRQGAEYTLNSSPIQDPNSIARMPSYPLAVKSPYLSAWLPGDKIPQSATVQAEFWNGNKLNWVVYARVDSILYSLFGAPELGQAVAANTTGANYTASHTYIYAEAGNANFGLDFFSPIFPGGNDYARQSLPYSMLTVSASGKNGQVVDVQVMSGIDQSWTSLKGKANLNYTRAGDVGFFSFNDPDAIAFSEHDQQASYGTIVFGALTGTNRSSTCQFEHQVVDGFARNGSFDKAAHACSKTDLATFAEDFGHISGSTRSVTFAIGVDREEAVNFLNTTTYTGYYRTVWPTIPEAIQFVFDQYQTTLEHSISFDNAIREKAESLSSTWGSQYAAIVAASVRQAFGSMELTLPLSSLSNSSNAENQTSNLPQPTAFIKEISTDGNVNTVDYISHVWPMFVSLNPSYIKFLLEPILAYLATRGWPHPWCVHDLGHNYPNATGHNNGKDESMPNYETSTLLTLTYAYQKLSGDTSLTQKHASLLESYAAWLAPNSLYPAKQLMNIDFIHPTANQTLLGVYSTIALQAASHLTANSSYAQTAAANAKILWEDGIGLDGTSPSTSSHFSYNYGENDSWVVMYPALSDVLLDLKAFPKEAWEMQSKWYYRQMTADGLPLGKEAGKRRDADFGSTDISIMAASVSSPELQQKVVAATYGDLTNGRSEVPFGAFYYVSGHKTGKWKCGKAKATVAGNFALMAMKLGHWYRP